MDIQDEILINKFGQGLTDIKPLLERFKSFDSFQRHNFLNDLLFLISQSKPSASDIELAILDSKLKPTFTPCVLLQKGIAYHNLKKIIELPPAESEKSFVLLMSLFKISYKRRFELEKNDPHKWWYWDLSNEDNVRRVVNETP